MLIAVSILSPVSTQSLIPASLMKEIVSAKSSCSLSSMAVDPTKSKFTSSCYAMAANFSSLSSAAVLAFRYLRFQE